MRAAAGRAPGRASAVRLVGREGGGGSRALARRSASRPDRPPAGRMRRGRRAVSKAAVPTDRGRRGSCRGRCVTRGPRVRACRGGRHRPVPGRPPSGDPARDQRSRPSPTPLLGARDLGGLPRCSLRRLRRRGRTPQRQLGPQFAPQTGDGMRTGRLRSACPVGGHLLGGRVGGTDEQRSGSKRCQSESLVTHVILHPISARTVAGALSQAGLTLPTAAAIAICSGPHISWRGACKYRTTRARTGRGRPPPQACAIPATRAGG